MVSETLGAYLGVDEGRDGNGKFEGIHWAGEGTRGGREE